MYPGILIKGNNNKPVTVLRDTGSAVHAVHANLVSDKDYTGRYQQLVTFGGEGGEFSTRLHRDKHTFLNR